LNALLEGFLFGLTLAVLAGPILFALLQAGIEHGFRAGMMVALGIFLSDVLFVVAVYFGLNYIQAMVKMDGFNLTLGIAGGIALILIGLGTYFSKPPSMPSDDFFLEKEIQEDLEEIPNKKNFSYFKLLLKGFVVNTLNPFTFFFWGVIAAGKLAESGFSENEFFLFFGAILFVIIATDTLKVSLAKVIRKYMKPKNILVVRKISGIAFVIFGIILIVRVMM
jgi:threonine/homoserine/homoserine lactone efflux protein